MFSYFGVPKSVKSDKDSLRKSSVSKSLKEHLKIRQNILRKDIKGPKV